MSTTRVFHKRGSGHCRDAPPVDCLPASGMYGSTTRVTLVHNANSGAAAQWTQTLPL